MNKNNFREKIGNMILTFKVRNVVQEAQPAKDISEVDTGVLDGGSVRRLEELLKSQLRESLEGLKQRIGDKMIDWTNKPGQHKKFIPPNHFVVEAVNTYNLIMIEVVEELNAELARLEGNFE